MEDTKTRVTETLKFQYRDETLQIALFGISEGQLSKVRNKIKILPSRMFLKLKSF